MPSGIDPVHHDILRALECAGYEPLETKEVHARAVRGPAPSIEGVRRRLNTLRNRGWVARADWGATAAWKLTDAGRAVLGLEPKNEYSLGYMQGRGAA